MEPKKRPAVHTLKPLAVMVEALFKDLSIYGPISRTPKDNRKTDWIV